MSLDNALEAWKELVLNVDFAISMVEKDKREAVYLETLAKPLLVSAAGATGGEVLKGTRKKN